MAQPPRSRPPVLVRVGVLCFALGLIAVVIIFGLFAAGAHDLPLWLNVAAMLAPVGFGLALIGLFRQARRGGPGPAMPAATRANRRMRSAVTTAPTIGTAPTIEDRS